MTELWQPGVPESAGIGRNGASWRRDVIEAHLTPIDPITA